MSDRVLIDAFSRGQRLSGDEFASHTSVPPSMISSESFTPTSVMKVCLRYLNNIDNIVMGLNIERTFDKPSAQWWV